MTPNPYDQACRFLLRQFPVPLLAWLLGLPAAELDFVGWLDTRGLPWPGQPDRTCDTVAHLRDPARGGLPWAVPVEFQIDPDPRMLGRGLGYLSGLWDECKPTAHRGDRFEVGLIVVNLCGAGRCSRSMRLGGSAMRTVLRAAERNLSRLSAERIMRRIGPGHTPVEVLPWVPLFQGGGEAGIIDSWLVLARQQKDEQLRSVLALVVLFAEAAGCVAPWREALEGWDMIESQIVKEWTELARERAYAKGQDEGKKAGLDEGNKAGLREGLLQGKVDTLLRLLRRPPLSLPSDLEQAVRAVADIARLDAALDAALSSSSLEEFRRTAGL